VTAGKPDQSLDEILSTYVYSLPESAIAQKPAEPRDRSRLLVLERAADRITHVRFRDLGRFLETGDLLVINDTRVVPARLLGRKVPSGGRAEVLFIGQIAAQRWEVMLRVSGKLRPGLCLDLGGGFEARVVGPLKETFWEVEIAGPGSLEAHLEATGHVPLPPYIRRPDAAADRTWYQTVFARRPGAVAAPTAGLHFTERLLTDLAAQGIATARVTLHVGPGTFRPLTSEELRCDALHKERYELSREAAEAVAAARVRGSRIVAVGTTSARVLETCAASGGHVTPGAGATRLFIHPPYKPQVVDALITNFHLPRTSLLMLVAAFVGRERVLAAYREAVEQGYRFYSYGDAMLIV